MNLFLPRLALRVRGYLENQVVRDNAVLASVETRIPLVRNTPWADSVQLAPFFDYGNAWNTQLRTLAPRNLLSVGLVVLGRNNPSLYTVNGRPLYVHLNGLAIVLLK